MTLHLSIVHKLSLLLEPPFLIFNPTPITSNLLFHSSNHKIQSMAMCLPSLFEMFLNGVGCFCCLIIIAGCTSHKSHGYYLCQIVECLNHVHLSVVVSFILGIEVLKLFLQHFIINFRLFLHQNQAHAVDIIYGLHHHFSPLFYCFHHAFMGRKVSLLHSYAFNKMTILSFFKF